MTSEARPAAITADSKIQVRAGVLVGVLWGLVWTVVIYIMTETRGHESRITVLEEKRRADDAATERQQTQLDKRLDRIETKLDEAIKDRRP